MTRRAIAGALAMVVWLPVAAGVAIGAGAAKLRYVTVIAQDGKGESLRRPEGVACNDKGAVIVADTGRGRLLRYVTEDRTVKPVGEMRAAQLTVPSRVQMNSREEVFALDNRQRRIVRFGANGDYSGYLTADGVPDQQSIVPRSFAIDRADHVYLLDVFSARVLVLDAAGKYQRHVDFPAGHGFLSDVAVDSRGSIYVVDSVKAAVHVARRNATAFSPLASDLRAHASFPTSIVVDGRGVLYLGDESGSSIVLVGQDGTVLGRQLAMGWTEGLLRSPAHLCLTDRNQLFVADRGNSRVQLFSIVR